MGSSPLADRDAVAAALDELDAAYAKLAALSLDGLTASELLTVLERRERMAWRQPAVDHAVIARLAAECVPSELGAKSLTDVLARRLRISRAEARRRLGDAEDLGPRTALTGEPLEPMLPNVAQAQAGGTISPEHVRIIRRFFDQLPTAVDFGTREHAEANLASIAAGLGPDELRQAADRLAALLDQDGQFSDVDRQRRRGLTIGRQGPDGMTPIRGLLDPQARAVLDAVLAKLAAPGMANPDDETPCVDGEPSVDGARRDTRTTAQRNHDGLTAACRAVLASGELGQLNGLPVTVIVSTTLAELESGAGHAVTGGGSLLPMSDVIRMASHAFHYLVVFDSHSQIPLYLGPVPADCLGRAADRVALLAWRVHVSRLHRARLSQPGTSRRGRLGRRWEDRRHRPDAGLRDAQSIRLSRWLAHAQTSRRPDRMDTAAQPRRWPNPGQPVSPPGALPDPGRRRRG